MNSYNQTKKIMTDLTLKINASNTAQKKKVFVVVLEGTEDEFEELKRLGAIEIEDPQILSRQSNLLNEIKGTNPLRKGANTENDVSFNRDISTGKSIRVESVITERDLAKLPGDIKEILLNEKAIITPLAKDLAKKRGIKIRRTIP